MAARLSFLLGKSGAAVVQNFYQDFRGAQRGVSLEVERAIAQAEKRAVERSVVAVSSARQRSSNFAKNFGQ
jgi:nucleoid-associated protein YejK